jgi:hypothetical protein
MNSIFKYNSLKLKRNVEVIQNHLDIPILWNKTLTIAFSENHHTKYYLCLKTYC